MRTRQLHLKRRHLMALASLVVIMAGVVWAGGKLNASAQEVGDFAPGMPATFSQTLHPVPIGVPAIRPHAGQTSTSVPRFTAADVKAYIAQYPPDHQVPGSPAASVVSVEFMSARDVTTQLQGESMGVPDDTLLCLVRLSGTFEDNVPEGATAAVHHSGVMVFDATTGNLLVSSVGA